ncbi:Qnr family pentapeptide repeat protein [Shewanella sp. VB17]|uniref:Qnr family pentapeptide repeat protein n=1 Tax=Shewanella sp. VB17 TaxID=2739432 RepID=UPI001566E1B2|nr:Qnr family pentapeptide repeat protein [Shewanella sp. VB17]NRD75828.1 Qnr family pentapeptide repeat protein [Shewanella sp. VB17]
MQASHRIFKDRNFSEDDLQDAIFEYCEFYRCDFSRADLSDASFIGCKFVDPNPNPECQLNYCRFNYANLTNTSFKQCRLNMALFIGATCFGIEIHECDLQGADFGRASFANHITHKTFFCSAFITACNLAYTNLEDALLEKCELFDNRWNGANLLGCSMKGSDLSGGQFSPSQWGTFELEACNLSRIELEGLDPRNVKLEGVMINQWQQEQLLAPFGLIVIPT